VSEEQEQQAEGDKEKRHASRGSSVRRWLGEWLPDSSRFSNGVIFGAAIWSVVVGLAIGIYTEWQWAKIGVALIATFAAGAVGALTGFLFGVPMSRSDGNRETKAQDGSFRPNTNLEQVSDWVTKIIVGLGLIQFRAIGTAVYTIGRSVGDAIGAPASASGSATAFGVALVVGSLVVAFLLCYMWTTTRLYQVFMTGNDGSPAVYRSPKSEPPKEPQQAAAGETSSGGTASNASLASVASAEGLGTI
jgi:MFS family permease